jgi:hypothetical protein
LFHCERHPHEMGERGINQFLTDLAVPRRSAAQLRTRPFARSCSCIRTFFLKKELQWVEPAVRVKKAKRRSRLC